MKISQKQTVINSDFLPNKVDVYEEFISWFSMPPSERKKTNIKTQEQFVNFYKIGINTPAQWKKRPDFQYRIREMRKWLAFEKTGSVIESIYNSAINGNPGSQTLWMKYFYSVDEEQELNKKKGTVNIYNIMFMIEALSKEKQEKYFSCLRDLLLDATIAMQESRSKGENIWNQTIPENWVPKIDLQ